MDLKEIKLAASKLTAFSRVLVHNYFKIFESAVRLPNVALLQLS